MAKLHELLAVEGSLKAQAEKIRTDLAQTFEKRRHLFTEKIVTFQSSEEKAPPVTEEQLDLQTTIRKELNEIAALWAPALDVSASVAETNTKARADVTLNGTVIFENLPATALLELEKRLGEIQGLVAAVPTLDPAKGFAPDPGRGAYVYKARDSIKTRTQKVQRAIVMYHATTEHPAQTQLISEDVPVGEIRTQEWSGMVTPAEKSDMLNRVERLRQAVKSARARANEADVASVKIGERLFKYVIDGE